MPTLILSLAPQTREAAAAVTAPRKNLRVLGSVPLETPFCGDYIRQRSLHCFKIGTERVRVAGHGLDVDFVAGIAYLERLGLARRDGGLHQFSVPPFERHFETAARHQARDLAGGQRSEEHTAELQSPC